MRFVDAVTYVAVPAGFLGAAALAGNKLDLAREEMGEPGNEQKLWEALQTLGENSSEIASHTRVSGICDKPDIFTWGECVTKGGEGLAENIREINGVIESFTGGFSEIARELSSGVGVMEVAGNHMGLILAFVVGIGLGALYVRHKLKERNKFVTVTCQ